MNVLILGCSFGVPDNGCPYEFHTENQLRQLNHTVYNCASRGAGNLYTLKLGREFLEKNSSVQIDWVVWFHTELIRDQIELYEKNLPYSIDEVSKLVYSEYASFLTNLNCKIAVIGGAAPVYPTFFDYITPDFCIPSWFNEILNLELPQIQTLSRLDIVESMQSVGLDRKCEILQNHEEILNALQACDDFPDNYHAGQRPHVELSKRLHYVMTGG